MSTGSRSVCSVRTLVVAAFLAAGAVACGDGGDAPAASPTPVEVIPSPSPTVAPTRNPTPAIDIVPQGWERHTTAHVRIDLPETWETFDLTEESISAIRDRLASVNPATTTFLEQLDPEVAELWAFDTESVEFLNNFSISRVESPLPTTLAATIPAIAQAYADLGITILSTEPDLTVAGLEAGRIDSSWDTGPGEFRQWYYVVQAAPNVQFGLVFVAEGRAFDSMKPLFEQMVESFRVIEAP